MLSAIRLVKSLNNRRLHQYGFLTGNLMFYSVLFLWPQNVFVLLQRLETRGEKKRGIKLFSAIEIAENIFAN